MAAICGHPNCNQPRNKACSGCLKEGYCSPECQKEDWKVHKILCKCKKNDHRFTHLDDCMPIIAKFMGLAESNRSINYNSTTVEIRILEYCLSFAEFQFGKRNAAYGDYGRDDGSNCSISYFNAEINTFHRLLFDISEGYYKLAIDIDIGQIQQDIIKNAMLFGFKSLKILEVWKVQISLDERQRTDSLDANKIDMIYQYLSKTELLMCLCYRLFASNYNKADFNKAENHIEKSLTYAKLIAEKEMRIEKVYDTLCAKGKIYFLQLKFESSKSVCEETYNLVAEAYNPTHPMVLSAANLLITTLIKLKEYYDAERYARICYECLTRPVDMEDEEVSIL